MPLTSTQITTLRTDIAADEVLNALPLNDSSFAQIASAYNAPASPAYTVWRTYVPVREITGVFIWTAVDSLTAGKARIWEWMATTGVIDPSKSTVRTGLADAFGSGTAMANAITPVLKRFATRAEKLFATGTGSDASPGTMTLEGMLGYQDIGSALNV